MKMPESEPNWRQRCGFGSGDFALNLFWQGAGFYLLFFYTHVLGLTGTDAGLIILIAGIWDVVSDPIMGYLAEKYIGRHGHYRGFLLYGSVPLAVSFMLLFWLPGLVTGDWQFAAAMGTLLLFRTCYTVVSIPYSAIGARVSLRASERTKLAGVRMYCGFLGGLMVVATAVLAREVYEDLKAFAVMALLCGVIAVPILWICFRETKQTRSVAIIGSIETVSFGRTCGLILQNRAVLLLAAAVFLATVAVTIFSGTIPFVFEYGLENKRVGYAANAIMPLVPLAAIPTWTVAALYVGKKTAWHLGAVLAVVGFFCVWYFSENIFLVTFFYAVISFGAGAFAVMLWSMLSDTIEFGEVKSGIRTEASLFGFVSAVQKLSIALSLLLFGWSLDQIGFEQHAIGAAGLSSDLILLVTAIPTVAIFLSSICIVFYPISEASHAAISGEIRQCEGERQGL